MEEKNENLKNIFLFVIAFCGWITAVKEGIELFSDITATTVISIGLVTLALVIYLVSYFARKKKRRNR